MNHSERSVPNTRINSIVQIETAFKLLASQGYSPEALSTLWAEHAVWLNSLDARAITDLDHQWATQLPEPASVEDHWVPERNAAGDIIGKRPEDLTAARCHVGRQYSLTPGQREILRERYGLTPTMVVQAVNVELFPGPDDVIWSITLKSVEHVDPRRRRHVLNEVVLQPASAFFRDAAAIDAARALDAEARKLDRKPREAKVPAPKSMALSYLT